MCRPQTTVVVKNIPYRFTRDDVVQLLDEVGLSGRHTYVYVPSHRGEKQRSTNFGYAFVRLQSSADVKMCTQRLTGKELKTGPGAKSVEVSLANHQHCPVKVRSRAYSPSGTADSQGSTSRTSAIEATPCTSTMAPDVSDQVGETPTGSRPTRPVRGGQQRRLSGEEAAALTSPATSEHSPPLGSHAQGLLGPSPAFIGAPALYPLLLQGLDPALIGGAPGGALAEASAAGRAAAVLAGGDGKLVLLRDLPPGFSAVHLAFFLVDSGFSGQFESVRLLDGPGSSLALVDFATQDAASLYVQLFA